MLNTFPALLTYGFFAPALLRIAAAACFAYLVWSHLSHSKEIARIPLPLIGAQSSVAYVGAIIEALVALALLFGYHTQIAAIAGAVLSLKYWYWSGSYHAYFIYSRAACFLLLVICLSLLLSGAGAQAIDLPL